jgi:hypothetical protein
MEQIVIIVFIFVTILLVLLGVIYYITNKESITDEVISLLNTKVSKMVKKMETSKKKYDNLISDVNNDMENKFLRIEKDIKAINETTKKNTHIDDDIVKNKSDILRNESGIASNQYSIESIKTDYNILNSNVTELEVFEGTFQSSLADLNTLFDGRKLYMDNKIHTLELDNLNFNTRINSNYALSSNNERNILINKKDIDRNYLIASNNASDLSRIENVDFASLSKLQLNSFHNLVTDSSSVKTLNEDILHINEDIYRLQDQFTSITSGMGDDFLENIDTLNTLIDEGGLSAVAASEEYSYILPNNEEEPLFRLMNHVNSKYISYHYENIPIINITAPFTNNSQGVFNFACNPLDYLISFETENKNYQNCFLFEEEFGNTQSHLTNYKYMIIDGEQVNKNIPITNNVIEGNVYRGELKSDLHFEKFKSLYVPSHMDLLFVNTVEDEGIRLRDYYPTQIFINKNTTENNYFWEFLHGTIANDLQFNGFVKLTNRQDIHGVYPDLETNMYRVTSVFLRNKNVPFSVIEFQQNEIVYWADLMSSVSLDYEFITNNGRSHTRYVIYIPEGAGIQIMDVNNVEIHLLSHTSRDNQTILEPQRIDPVSCLENVCKPSQNPIIAIDHSITIHIMMKSVYNAKNSPYNAPVFKVI